MRKQLKAFRVLEDQKCPINIRHSHKQAYRQMSLRKIQLATLESVPQRVDNLKRSLEIIYGARLHAFPRSIPIDRIFPTEDFLENDKLALVFMKIVNEDYDVPIIAVQKGEDHFVLDGHHRSFIYAKLKKKTIKAIVLVFPRNSSYREVSKASFEDLPIKTIRKIEDPILKVWGTILNILKQYEALYHVHFHMEKKNLALGKLHPTQPQIMTSQLKGMKRIVAPITCIESNGEDYVLDGHARCIRARQLGSESIQAMILQPEVHVNFGIIKTAQEMKLKSLDDISICKDEH
jgi:hypothetical protein